VGTEAPLRPIFCSILDLAAALPPGPPPWSGYVVRDATNMAVSIWGVGWSRSCTGQNRRHFSAPVNWCSRGPAGRIAFARRPTAELARWHSRRTPRAGAARSFAWRLPGLDSGQTSKAQRRHYGFPLPHRGQGWAMVRRRGWRWAEGNQWPDARKASRPQCCLFRPWSSRPMPFGGPVALMACSIDHSVRPPISGAVEYKCGGAQREVGCSCLDQEKKAFFGLSRSHPQWKKPFPHRASPVACPHWRKLTLRALGLRAGRVFSQACKSARPHGHRRRITGDSPG
jgi:hypothetical protein